MAGNPGTNRFAQPADVHVDGTSANGESEIRLQSGKNFTEKHQTLNPEQLSRDMGSTLGAAPCRCYDPEKLQADYPCNHDGFIGGNSHISNLDELKVLRNTVYSVPVAYAEDLVGQNGDKQRS